MRGGQQSPREAAWRAVLDYDRRQPPWDGLLRRCLKGLEGADRGLAAELLTGCLRHQRLLDALLEKATGRKRKESKTEVWALLRVGAYQITHLERVPDHAAVNETVDLASRHAPAAKGFVNAALRGLIRLREEGDPAADLAPIIRHSFPDRIWKALGQLLPDEEREAAATALNDPGDLGLRINALVPSTEDFDFPPHPLVPGCMVLPREKLPQITPALERGELAIQDAASQLVAHLVAPQAGQRIVDLCAAPGGKSLHLASIANNDLTLISTDVDKQRLEEMRDNFKRLNLTRAQVVDIAMAEMLMAEPEPDTILIDAPCSGWGTVRHKPDLKWRERDAGEMTSRQRKLLDQALKHLSPGGSLVYSVCTFLPEETEDLIEAFLEAHPEVEIQDAREVLPPALHGVVQENGMVRTWPHRHACDGFFAARMRVR